MALEVLGDLASNPGFDPLSAWSKRFDLLPDIETVSDPRVDEKLNASRKLSLHCVRASRSSATNSRETSSKRGNEAVWAQRNGVRAGQ